MSCSFCSVSISTYNSLTVNQMWMANSLRQKHFLATWWKNALSPTIGLALPHFGILIPQHPHTVMAVCGSAACYLYVQERTNCNKQWQKCTHSCPYQQGDLLTLFNSMKPFKHSDNAGASHLQLLLYPLLLLLLTCYWLVVMTWCHVCLSLTPHLQACILCADLMV